MFPHAIIGILGTHALGGACDRIKAFVTTRPQSHIIKEFTTQGVWGHCPSMCQRMTTFTVSSLDSIHVLLLTRSAVKFIDGSFSQRNAHVKALTTQGSLMSSISFRAEVTGKVGLHNHSSSCELLVAMTPAVLYYWISSMNVFSTGIQR